MKNEKTQWPKPNESGVYSDDGTAKRIYKSFGNFLEIERYVELAALQVASDEWVSGHYYTTGEHFRDGDAFCRINGVHKTFVDALLATAGKLWDYMAKRSRDGVETDMMNWLADICRCSSEEEIDQVEIAWKMEYEEADSVKDEDPACYDGKPVGVQPSTCTILEISARRVYPCPYQTRSRFENIEELAASIKAHGLLQPIAVRASTGGYELIAGERRLRAFRVAFGDDSMIPARVLNVSDSEAAELCVTENMQRSDLTPLEEAEGVKYLLDTQHTIQDAADRLGRSPLWVRRRSNLLSLCQDVRDAIEDTEHNMSIAPIEGLELIAALPEDLQCKVANQFNYKSPTIAAIKLAISGLMHDLKNATFSVIECKKCLRRTGVQPDLFDGGETSELGRCLDLECWRNKQTNALAAMVTEIGKEAPGAIIISEEYEIRQSVPGIIASYEVKKCKHSDKNAVLAYSIDNAGEAKKIWIEKPSEAISASSDSPRRPTPEQKSKAEYIKSLRTKIEGTLENSTGVSKAVAGHPFTSMPAMDVLKVLLVTGTNCSNSYATEGEWEAAFDLENLSVRDRLWPKVALVLIQRIRYNTIVDCDADYLEAVDINQYLFEGVKA